MIEVDVAESDGWWLKRLAMQMHSRPVRTAPRLGDARRCDYTRNEWLDMLWARFTGDAPLHNLDQDKVQATRDFLRMSRTNYAGLIVRAIQDRTHFAGATSSADADADGDDTVRDFLSSNGSFMDDALMYSYALGVGFVLVTPPSAGGVATATAEDPRHIAISSDPVNPQRIRAGLKLYRDADLDQDVAHLYLPGDGKQLKDRVRKAVRRGPNTWTGLRFEAQRWEWLDNDSGPTPDSTQGLGVPLVPFFNLLGMGEFEAHLDLLDRITNGIADRLWSAKFQLYIQRALQAEKDADAMPEKDEDTGEEIDYNAIFSSDPGALWRMPPGYKVWEGRQLDINMFLAPVRDDLKELSSVSQTPLHMFTPDAMTGSAEGASTMKETLTLKAEDRINRFRPASVRVARLGLAYSGKPSTDELHPMWGPAERYSLQQRSDAAVKAKTSGVPSRSILSEIWQFPPATVRRMEDERRADALYATEVLTEQAQRDAAAS